MAPSSSKSEYDLVVIGSGPAGIQAAVQAAKLKKSVLIIEKSPTKIGGAWIHTGTLPSKTIRESLDMIHSIRHHAGAHWVERIINDLSTTKLIARAEKVSLEEEALVRRYLKKNKIEIMTGKATIEDKHTVVVKHDGHTESKLTAKVILVATGSRPRRQEGIPFDGWRVVDSDELLKLDHVPRSIVIFGAGVIGCEYACIFGALGVDTTLVDARDRLMQTLDFEVVKSLEKAMIEMGIKIRLGCQITDVKNKGPRVEFKICDDTLETDVLFYAAGRMSNSDGLGLEKLGIKINDRGAIAVNEHFQTSIPNIYAAGDVVGPPALASTSAQQGRFCAMHAFAKFEMHFPKLFPIGVYTIPELSSVGPSEEELKAKGVDYVVGRAGYGEIARGYIRGDNHGLLKLIVCAKTHKILAIHIVGEGAANLIHIGLAFMLKDGHAQDLINLIFNYPTLAEAYRIAAFNALNKIFADGNILPPPEDKSKKGSAA